MATDNATGKQLIMCVGLVCVDLVYVTKAYPVEDTDQRVLTYRIQRGGNASNSCTILRLLGRECEFLGTFAKDSHLGFIKEDLQKYGIHTSHCVCHSGSTTPVSVAIVNAKNGTRTILHGTRDLPEISLEDFRKIPLASGRYRWIHFEGRPSTDTIEGMLKLIDQYNGTLPDSSKRITTSVELEKCRDNLDILENKADFVFVSKDYARFRGCNSMESSVDYFASRCKPGATVICPWGELGASAKTPDGQVHASPAFPPDQIRETLGAGDTFNAATIHALCSGADVPSAIRFGCQVAGAKVGMIGYDGVKSKGFTVPTHT